MSGRIIPTIWGKGQGFPGIGSPPTFWRFMVGLKTVMEHVGVSFSMPMYYNERTMNEAQGLLEVESSTFLDLVGSH